MPKLLTFQRKYLSLLCNYREPIYIANYFYEAVLNRVENTARRGKFKKMLKKREIRNNGTQRLTNTQIWEVMKLIVEPRNAQKMKEILKESLYDPVKYQKYHSAKAIEDDFEGHINEYIYFKKTIVAWLALVITKKSKVF